MVSIATRIGYSIVGQAMGVAGVSVAIGGLYLFNERGSAAFMALFYLGMISLSSISGWLLALPLIVWVNNVNGLRFWLTLSAGTALGPVAVWSTILYNKIRNGSWNTFGSETQVYVMMGGCVAAIATLTFLLLLRRAERRAESEA
jgi:hypothetical protein